MYEDSKIMYIKVIIRNDSTDREHEEEIRNAIKELKTVEEQRIRECLSKLTTKMNLKPQ